jgi:hypothetical protein
LTQLGARFRNIVKNARPFFVLHEFVAMDASLTIRAARSAVVTGAIRRFWMATVRLTLHCDAFTV